MHIRRNLIACLFLVGLIQWSHAAGVKACGAAALKNSDSWVPNAAELKRASLGYDQLLADIYWLSFIQYIGDGPARAKDHCADAEKYIDLIVSLDPKLIEVYYFATFVLGDDLHQPFVAARIIDTGIQANQDNWYLPFIAGFNQYLYAHDIQKAAKYYRMASRFPNCPAWLERQAKILESKLPPYITQINVWDSIYNSTSEPAVKDKARAKLMTLWLYAYNNSHSPESRKNAVVQLQNLGFVVIQK